MYVLALRCTLARHCAAKRLAVFLRRSDQQIQSMMVHNEHLISEREQDITQINKQVKEVSKPSTEKCLPALTLRALQVNEIFKDLADIVETQKADIDTIESTIESSHASAKEGVNQVKKAAELQPKCAIQ